MAQSQKYRNFTFGASFEEDGAIHHQVPCALCKLSALSALSGGAYTLELEPPYKTGFNGNVLMTVNNATAQITGNINQV